MEKIWIPKTLPLVSKRKPSSQVLVQAMVSRNVPDRLTTGSAPLPLALFVMESRIGNVRAGPPAKVTSNTLDTITVSLSA